MEGEIENENLLGVITHVFLPKKTPEKAEECLGDIEHSIIRSVSRTVTDAIQQSPFPELEVIGNMLNYWELLQPKSKLPCRKEEDRFVRNFAALLNLTSIIPIYIRKQNFTVLIECQGNGAVCVDTFKASLPSKIVMGYVRPMSMDFPDRSEIIQDKELLSSPVFARNLYQLAVHEFQMEKSETCIDKEEVLKPILVSDWIVAALSPSIQRREKLTVNKRIRDQVTVTAYSSLHPFRRSGLWMSIKVAIHLKLLKLFLNDTETSKIVYKLLMLRVLGDICQDYYKNNGDHIDLDLAIQMLAKVGRRTYKISRLKIPARGKSKDDFIRARKVEGLRITVLEHVEGVARKLHESMKECQFKMTGFERTLGLATSLKNHRTNDYLQDLDHSIPFLSSYKEVPHPTPANCSLDNTHTEELRQSMELERYPTLDAILTAGRYLGKTEINLKERIWLHDTETYMKFCLETVPNTGKIKELMQTYMTNALQLYNGNPIGISQLVLVVLKTVEVLHKRTAQAHPFILNYRSGVNCSAFDCLMLPHKDDMTLLEKALGYFKSVDTRAKMKNEEIVPRVIPNEDSFAVQFAAQNADMIKLRDEILRKTEENIAQKFAQITKAREKCKEILAKFEDHQREAEMGSKNFPQFIETTAPLEEQLLRIRKQFTRFEKPLPTQLFLQNAIVFEMIVPDEIADLRDCLAILKFDLLEESSLKKQRKIQWKSYRNLRNYFPTGTLLSKTNAFILGSYRESFSETFDATRNPDIMCCTNKMLIWENALECLYSYSHNSYSFNQPMENLKLACALKINQMENSLAYSALQEYLQSYNHFQNTVIANQHFCNDNLPLDEFITFGSLRAGHRIQIRNLYRAIASKQLSLEEEPVLALIFQALWQLGPCEGESLKRDAHFDFEDAEFSSAMLELVENVAKANETNYGQPLVLMAVVAITVRIFELNVSLQKPCYALLKHWRCIMKKWTSKIEKGMQDESNPQILGDLQKTLLIVRICSALTYIFSSSITWDMVMKNEEDVTEFFHTIFILNQKEDAEEGAPSFELSAFIKILLNFAKTASLRFQLGNQVIQNPFLSRSLHLFASEKWSKATFCHPPTVQYQGGQENLVRLSYKEKCCTAGQGIQSYFITYDLIMGTFLVNGYPTNILPSDITKGPTFQRYFQQNTRIRVQQESPVTYSTVAKFHGRHYEFRTTGKKTFKSGGSYIDVLIKERLDDDTELILMKHGQFEGAIADHFVYKYSHWLDNNKKILYLRKVPFKNSDYDLPHEFKLVKKFSGMWHLYDEGNHCNILSSKSAGFGYVTKQLEGLEASGNINVMMNGKTKVVSAHLSRYNLQFVVKKEGLECVQYPGLYLIVPKLWPKREETLVGLQQSIRLKGGDRQIMLVPNGRISIKNDPKWHHHQTLISLQGLRQPAYFTYEFDKVLKRLVANKSKQAWLYLAALHAVTSSPLPDPFTEVTGTEMAVRILQSGFVWSSSPYDEESLRTLRFIESFSPTRTYYRSQRNRPESMEPMEIIEWPEIGLPSMSAFDGFAILVEKLIEDSERLDTLYYVDQEVKRKKKKKNQLEEQQEAQLRHRSYFRHLTSYNESAAVKPHYVKSAWTSIFLSGGKSIISLASTKDEPFEACMVLKVSSVGSRFDSTAVPSSFTTVAKQWLMTGQLGRFVEKCQGKLHEVHLPIASTEKAENTSHRSGVVIIGEVEWKLKIGLNDVFDGSERNEGLWKEAKEYFRAGIIPNVAGIEDDQEDKLISKRSECQMKVHTIMQNMLEMVNGTEERRILLLSGICPRTDPSSLLKFLILEDESSLSGVEYPLKIYAGAMAVLWTHIARLNRCLIFLRSGLIPELQRELHNKGHENWKPTEYPAWLLLELELNLMIRSVQVNVAKQMIKMPFGANGVLQLNMGEGKTSVIVPMLCSVLGNNTRFCRVTVLGSMFNMNHDILSFAIGGLLNQRVYTFPCKRDMQIDGSCVEMIHNAYKECMGLRGVVLTQPDQRLSFRLLAYDSILKQKIRLGLRLLETEDWLRRHARDVLDESDELLNVKYQLVYTVGAQLPLDGGDLRWTTCQKLLKIVHQIGAKFLKKYGHGKVEMDEDEYAKNPHQFTPIRLLDKDIYPEFVSAVADHVLSEINGTKEEKLVIKKFLTEKDLKQDDLKLALKILSDAPEQLNKILIISGYLRREVLVLGLSKRWRVEYGVDAQKTYRKMAVPFRAKDVPAERAEFGHPDLAILLTYLSYYYSGLSESQVTEIMKLLKLKQGSDAVYDSWIQKIPDDQLEGFPSTYRGLNMKDAFQKSKLVKLLSRHKLVIDYWLSNKVFHLEAKQFPAKLVLTAWDLCYERGEHPVTGFSGTNDSRMLLPIPISQQDLPSLQDTNRRVERFLLRLENDGHRELEMGVSCEDILHSMKKDQLSVLIDAGALILEWDNERLATEWLAVDDKIQAVVYFRGNELMVKSRSVRAQQKEQDVPFTLSSYQGRLDKCGVFLDDQHTRGTDLKFPTGSRACVTVGGRMKRDKLIQACMRMRKLGDGHSVTFYLSHEAYDMVKEVGQNVEDNEIATRDVLEWVRQNTQSFNENGLLYWALAGKNYAQRLAAEDNFHYPTAMNSSEEAAAVLGLQCRDDEITKLIKLYGQHSHPDLLVKVIPRWFAETMEGLKRKHNNCELPMGIQENFERICEQVIGRCQKHVPHMTHLFGQSMEEEQERELELETEMEVEEERVVEREKANPAKHNLHENVIKVVVHGEVTLIRGGIMRLCDIFKDTTYWGEVQPEGWGKAVFATTDFIKVISDVTNTDQFLRPVEWLVSMGGKSGSSKIMLLSPFEVNELLPYFRRKEVKCRLHMFSLRRSVKQELLLNDHRLMLPKGCSSTAIPEGSRSTAALLMASGNLYFKNMEEQRGFARFLCLALSPWNEIEHEAFKNKMITKAGFMLPEFRLANNYYKEDDAEEGTLWGFNEDPTLLVHKILKCKHPVLSEKAHVVQLLDEKRYVMMG